MSVGRSIFLHLDALGGWLNFVVVGLHILVVYVLSVMFVVVLVAVGLAFELGLLLLLCCLALFVEFSVVLGFFFLSGDVSGVFLLVVQVLNHVSDVGNGLFDCLD